MIRIRLLQCNQKGLTLLEVLAAFTLLAIIFAAIFPFVTGAIKNNKTVEQSHQALYLAKEQLSIIQSSDGVQHFLTNIQDGAVTEDLSKTNSKYSDLKLDANIQETVIQEKADDKSKTTAVYYVLDMKEGKLRVKAFIRALPDYKGTPNLHRTILEVYDVNNKLLTKTYGYIKHS